MLVIGQKSFQHGGIVISLRVLNYNIQTSRYYLLLL